MKAKILIEFTMNNVISKSDLEEFYGGDMSKCIKQLFKEDHFIGMVEDKYKIVNIRVVK